MSSGAKQRRSNKYPGVTVIENISGKISYGIDYVLPSGQRVRKILKGCKSERQASQIRAIEIAAASQGELVKKYGLKNKTKSILFHKAIDLYDEWAKDNKKSYYGEKFTYGVIKRSHLFEGKFIAEISPMLAERFKSERAKDTSKNTANKYIIACRQIVEKMIAWGYHTGENPFKAVENFKISKGKRPGSLYAREVQAIIDQIRSPVKRDMVAFAFYTGWRIGSIRKLRKEDYNQEHRSIWLMDPKSGRTTELALCDAAAEIVEHNIKKSNGEFVFCKKNGEPFKTAMNAVIGNAAERAGVVLPTGKKWHAFRRTWTTHMFKSGADIGSVRDLGNWSDDTMPLWYNDGLRFEEQRKILNKIPRLDSLKNE